MSPCIKMPSAMSGPSLIKPWCLEVSGHETRTFAYILKTVLAVFNSKGWYWQVNSKQWFAPSNLFEFCAFNLSVQYEYIYIKILHNRVFLNQYILWQTMILSTYIFYFFRNHTIQCINKTIISFLDFRFVSNSKLSDYWSLVMCVYIHIYIYISKLINIHSSNDLFSEIEIQI